MAKESAPALFAAIIVMARVRCCPPKSKNELPIRPGLGDTVALRKRA